MPFEGFAALRVRGATLDELRLVDDRSRATRQQERESGEGAARLTFSLEEILYYGEVLTLREAGTSIGISEARACQLHGRAIENLRRDLTPARQVAAA